MSPNTAQLEPLLKPANSATPKLQTLNYYPSADGDNRKLALFSFAGLLILWNILGHTVLGFEQSPQQPLIAVAAACFTQWLLEYIEARSKGRTARYIGSLQDTALFFTPALISGLAVGMLIYPERMIMPIVFASVASIASKILIRAPIASGGTQHVFNPSNFGITLTLFALPFVGVAPPYHFVENLNGLWCWLVPLIILFTGLVIHGRLTHRLPLITAWLFGFVAQAFLRHLAFAIPIQVPLAPMTSAAFIIFTLYMIPDPATTPINRTRQILFGLSVASIYGLLQVAHLFFGLFVALIGVSFVRGLGLYWEQVIRAVRAPGNRLNEARRAPEIKSA